METRAEIDRLLKDERFAEAERLLDGLIASTPRDPELLRLRAAARHFQYDLDPWERRSRVAEDLISAIEAGRSTYDEATIQSCSLLFHWGHEGEFEPAVAAMLAERPDDGAQAHYQRARCLERFRSDIPGALTQVDRSIALQPHWRSHLFRALLRFREDNYAEATDDLDESLRLNPRAREARLARARQRMMLSNFPGAVADYEETFAFAPPMPAAYEKGDEMRGPPAAFNEWMEMAEAHLKNGEPGKAAEDFDHVLGYLPHPPPDLLFQRAQARRLAGDRAGAIEDLERALKADADFEPARALMAELTGRD